MAEEENQTAEESVEESSGGSNMKKKLMVIGGVVFVAVIVGLAIVLYFNGFFTKNGEGSKSAGNGKKTETVKKEKISETSDESAMENYITSKLGDIVINPTGSGGSRFLKCTIVVRVNNDQVIKEIEKKKALLIDRTSTIIGALTISEIDQFNVEEFDGRTMKEKTKLEIKENLNKYLNSGKIMEVYFKEFIVQ